MKVPESPFDYSKFAFLIKNKNRDPSGSWCKNFLEYLLATRKTRTIELPEKTKLWRSQLGRDKPIIAGGSFLDISFKPFPPHRMKPLSDEAKEGRANPSDVPVLYLSTDRKTAMAECRPWLDAYISIGMFCTSRSLKIIDFSKDEYIRVTANDKEKNDDQHYIEKIIWGCINKAFMKPVQLSVQIADNKLAQEIAEHLNSKNADYISPQEIAEFFKSKNKNADYTPLQEIAEFFKSNGYDGLKYKSAQGKGYNMALFDISSAEQANCSLVNVKSIQHSFEPIEEAKYKTPFGENIANYEGT